MLYLGVDPGWRNLGWSVIDGHGGVIRSGTFDPKSLPLGSVGEYLIEEVGEVWADIEYMCMERFVYYDGVHNADSEHILLVTGQLQATAHAHSIPLRMFKAIQWKTHLSKMLFKTSKFRNPSDRFDKKFSIAAAEHISGIKFKKDHEADATCLALLAKKAHDFENR